eukprot:scaffold22531_cov98-Cylindrotheca_fusiformis.AAC.3
MSKYDWYGTHFKERAIPLKVTVRSQVEQKRVLLLSFTATKKRSFVFLQRYQDRSFFFFSATKKGHAMAFLLLDASSLLTIQYIKLHRRMSAYHVSRSCKVSGC